MQVVLRGLCLSPRHFYLDKNIQNRSYYTDTHFVTDSVTIFHTSSECFYPSHLELHLPLSSFCQYVFSCCLCCYTLNICQYFCILFVTELFLAHKKNCAAVTVLYCTKHYLLYNVGSSYLWDHVFLNASAVVRGEQFLIYICSADSRID